MVPNFDSLKRWAQQNGIDAQDNVSLLDNEKVQKHYDAIIADVNRGLGRVEQIKRFCLLKEPFSAEKGEVTPTLKIKRKAVQQNYSDLIEGMYKE